MGIVEILVSFSILLIIIVAFSALFTNSTWGIFTSGYKNKALYDAQYVMENAIANQGVYTDESCSVVPGELNIPFNAITAQVNGNFVTVNKPFTSNGVSIPVTIMAFIPTN